MAISLRKQRSRIFALVATLMVLLQCALFAHSIRMHGKVSMLAVAWFGHWAAGPTWLWVDSLLPC